MREHVISRYSKHSGFCLVVLLNMPLPALAQAARPAYVPPESAVTAGGVIQVVFSLLLVLGAIVLAAWILKKINLPQYGAGNVLKVIGGIAVGQRERIVLVEVKDTWLVVGVAPGQVRTLYSMPKSELPAMPDAGAPGMDGKFQVWLKQMMEKRNAGK